MTNARRLDADDRAPLLRLIAGGRQRADERAACGEDAARPPALDADKHEGRASGHVELFLVDLAVAICAEAGKRVSQGALERYQQ